MLRPENGTSDSATYVDLDARDKWFFQAQIESPAMFRRSAGAGSLYWLGTRDATGAFLDGANSYRLAVPLPVPHELFWSITIYDTETRSEILTDQQHAALRSTVELTTDQLGPDASVAELKLRTDRARQRRSTLDQDDPRQGLVRVLPHLRP